MENILETIPDKPMIPLRNYLLNLVGEGDGKESSLYLHSVECFIREFWNEIIQNNWRKIKVRKFIPAKFGAHATGLYHCKNGKKAISIQMFYNLLIVWKEYCGKTKEGMNKRWGEVFSSDFTLSSSSVSTKIKLPKFLTPKLSYFLGWMCGDGHLRADGNHCLVKISEKSTKQLESVLAPLFKELFDVEPPVFNRYMGGYAIQIGSKPIFRFLTNVLEIKVGRIPAFIENLDMLNKKYFLLGLFDSEGYINSSYLDSAIVISQADLDFLKKVIKLFKEFDIQFTGPYFHSTRLGTWYTIRVRKKSEIIKFANQIGSCHIEKLQRLRELVTEIEKNRDS